MAAGQEPFAAILGCSDSRVPVEIVFDQGLGDLFVIRVAGNIVAPSLIGSVEFAAEQFGTRLVVVLGHSRCGAIETTLEQLRRPVENQSRNLHSIVDFIRPAVEGLLTSGINDDHDALVHEAVRANIRASVNHLRHGSEIIENLIQNDGLMVVGAEYSLETGVVDFFENLPDRYRLRRRRPDRGRMHCVDSRHQCRPRQSGDHGRFARLVHRSRPRKCTHDIEQRQRVVPMSAPQRAQAVPRHRSGDCRACGFSASVMVLTAADLAAIIDENPLLKMAKEPARHLVAFVADAKRLDPLRPLLEESWKPDALAITDRAASSVTRTSTSGSRR